MEWTSADCLVHPPCPPRAGSSDLCAAGHWASKDRNSTPTLGSLYQCLISFAIKKKGFFLCLSGNSVFLFVASSSVTGHYWEKSVSAVPCPGVYPHSSQSVWWPSASPGPFPQSFFPPTLSPISTGALGFSSPVQGFAFPLLNFKSFLLADCYLFLHD